MRIEPAPPRRWVSPLARLAMLLLACGWLLGPAQIARANSITVTTASDTVISGKCRLRDAIVAANTNTATNGCPAGAPGLDTITFNWGPVCHVILCSLVLNSSLPPVTDALTIDGSGLNPIISGAGLYRIFALNAVAVDLTHLRLTNGQADVGAGILLTGTTLTLNGLQFSNNHATNDGGAIYLSSGTVVITNSSFLDNSAYFGGAIAQAGGALIIAGSSFSTNSGGAGGAIGLIQTSRLAVTDSTFDGNSASVWGGAIYLQDATVQASLARSSFTNNQATTTTFGYGGGALFSGGALTLADSTLANNVSNTEAGALEMSGGQVTVSNTTLTGNTARRFGGGILAFNDGLSHPAFLSLNNVTISGNTADVDNSADGDGGGVAMASGTLTVTNSILAGNFDTPNNSGAGLLQPDCSGAVTAAQYTLVGRGDGCTGLVNGSNGNKVGTIANPINPLLAALADNGGATQTQALLDGSPAFNAGNPLAPGSSGFACAAADQRGVPRPLGLVCDMGAFEAGMRLYLPAIQK